MNSIGSRFFEPVPGSIDNRYTGHRVRARGLQENAGRVPSRGDIANLCIQVIAALALAGVALPLHAEQTGAGRRLLVADDSKQRLAIVAADGSLEWELKVGAIHDAAVLPSG